MAYCTLDDILSAMDEQDVIHFSNDVAFEAGAVDDKAVTSAINGATAIIDSYISGRYGANLPDPVPGLIVSLAVDISLYKLTGRKGDAPDEYRTRYEDALKHLERISAGKVNIPGVILDDVVTGIDDPAAAVVSQSSYFSGTGSGLAGH